MTTASKKQLIDELKKLLPERWEISRLQSRVEGDSVEGTIKIHCLEDDKVFLSDFAAKLGVAGNIQELELDGISLGKFIGRQHQK